VLSAVVLFPLDDVSVCRSETSKINQFCFETPPVVENIVTLFVKWTAPGAGLGDWDRRVRNDEELVSSSDP